MERQKDRMTERQTDRQTDKKTDDQKKENKKTEGQKDIKERKKTEGQRDRETERQEMQIYYQQKIFRNYLAYSSVTLSDVEIILQT